MANVFLTGASGFVGRNLAAKLIGRGHSVRGLVRPGSEGRLPKGCRPVIGDPLDPATYASRVAPADIFVQLVGVTHPSPAKAAEFRAIDLVAGMAAVEAAVSAGVRHFVYVSVAQPAPIMKEYIAVRHEVEEKLRRSGLNATVLRPWYVLGPGRRWPLLLLPMYWLMGAIPSTRDSARRLGLVTLAQMIDAMARAVEDPPEGVRVWEVPEIRRFGRATDRSGDPHRSTPRAPGASPGAPAARRPQTRTPSPD